MATLTVLKFGSVDGAEKGLKLVEDLQKQALITIHDAAVVAWPAGGRKPKTKHMANLAGAGALDGAFWGMLFGLIFFVPFFGMAIGAIWSPCPVISPTMASTSGSSKTWAKVTEGTSPLFLLTSDAVTDRVVEAAKTLPKFEIIATNLPKDQEDKLRTAFARELLNGLFQTTETMTCATSR